MVLCVEAKTSWQPRPRRHATRPAKPGRPNQVAHAYRRAGALHRLAAFDTHTGRVYGQCDGRKRQQACIAFLEARDTTIPAEVQMIPLVCDNARAQTGKQVHAWLQAHPRVVLHVTPGHCAWLHPVEQWFAILQRTRRRIVDGASKADLEAKLLPGIADWNAVAHPCNWTTKSVAKVRADTVPAAA